MRRLPVHLTADVLAEFAGIRSFHRESHGPAVSHRVIARIRESLRHIGRMPKTGALRLEFGDGVQLHVSGLN